MADYPLRGSSQSKHTQIAAEKAKQAAEESFKLGNPAMAVEQAFAALDLNPKLPMVQNYITAYLVHSFASILTFCKKKKKDDTLVLYSILFIEDCSADVDEATIRKHYKEIALSVHPDKNDSAAAEGAFKIVRQAYETLISRHRNRGRKTAGRRW
ncbi:hypothetical protein COLO4_12930 [Corchorus olitorius]|uniref:J domain-containing protein n=1 Tax=Corchorus olitorius TaxID=93759 RepID=A0A1R3JZ11_9ROSI|nr:hypothetical protein COLO4_12930 [Corchorus olitorius]